MAVKVATIPRFVITAENRSSVVVGIDEDDDLFIEADDEQALYFNAEEALQIAACLDALVDYLKERNVKS